MIVLGGGISLDGRTGSSTVISYSSVLGAVRVQRSIKRNSRRSWKIGVPKEVHHVDDERLPSQCPRESFKRLRDICPQLGRRVHDHCAVTP
jgi:hypothetical protein